MLFGLCRGYMLLAGSVVAGQEGCLRVCHRYSGQWVRSEGVLQRLALAMLTLHRFGRFQDGGLLAVSLVPNIGLLPHVEGM